jgi:hypothetical protein
LSIRDIRDGKPSGNEYLREYVGLIQRPGAEIAVEIRNQLKATPKGISVNISARLEAFLALVS